MGKINTFLHAFNGGVWDKDILPRVDQEKARLVAEDQTNWMASVTGRMFLRPGQEYLGSTASNAQAELREFVFGAQDAALFEFTNNVLRIWNDDALVTRPSVTSTVTSGDFSASTGWTLASTTGQTTTVSGGYLNLTASGKGSLALAKQQVSTSSTGTRHALRVVVDRGPVTFRVGSTEGGDEYFTEATLREGTHSLAFTPSGSYWIQFQSDSPTLKRVDSVTVESSGTMTLPTPYTTADLPLLRMAQSADVVFIACAGKQQYRIERWDDESWSIVKYLVDDGPFTSTRTAPVRLKPAATQGNTTLTADKPFFTSANVGSLFRLFHTGQKVIQKISAGGQYTDPIQVDGVNNSDATDTEDRYDDRSWSFAITGTWAGTIKTERSYEAETFGYSDYRLKDSAATVGTTSNDSGTNTDIDSNAIVWYRMGFPEGLYTSGSADISITYEGGGGFGWCRVTAFNSSTSVDVEVLSPFKNTTYTDDWQEGEWSSRRGWPSSVALAEGRLWWAGLDRLWGSISDAYGSFDDEFEGDAGPISRSIATGGVNQVQWIMTLQRLIFGTDGAETSARSSSFDEPLSPTNTTLKNVSTIGSAPVSPARIDSRGLFVDRSGNNIFELGLNIETAADYESNEVTRLAASFFSAGITKMAVQRRPDTRVWVVLDDGSVMCIVYEPQQNVIAFIPIETDGEYESVAVLPGAEQDRVYFSVKRTINSSTVRFVEKMALDSEAKPATLCKVMDAFKVATPSGTTVSGATHLIGETVVAWADGAPITTTSGGQTARREFTVDGSGEFELDEEVDGDVVYGLPYRARYKSGRAAYGAEFGTAMLQRKKIDKLGIILTDYARAGFRYGSAFDDTDQPLSRLPTEVEYETASAVVSSAVDDEDVYTFGSGWDLDTRVCLETNSPFPASVLGVVLSVTTSG